MNLKNERKTVTASKLFARSASVIFTVMFEVWPERRQLVPFLQFPQILEDLVEEVGALEAAAVAVDAEDDRAEAADQNSGPVHLELLRHHLPAGCPVPVGGAHGRCSASFQAS